MSASRARHIPVLIVGGGPVGLALACELSWRGIICELVEQTDGAITTPKMNEVNIRTMEFCRRWGIAGQVRNCPFPDDWPLDIVFVTSLSGYELGRMRRPPRAGPVPDGVSPERLQACSQMWFDPILRAFAQSFPTVSLRHRTRLESFADQDDRVIADLVDLDSGAHQRVTVDYLIACDGSNSSVREALGIGLLGKGVLGHPASLYFRAPGLLETCGKENGTFFLAIDRNGLWANIRVVDPRNALWRIMVLDTAGQPIDRDAVLRRALGKPMDVEWTGISPWTRRSAVAERYGQGRIFLAGDAVHQLSPTGALGMNTGIGDAVDLGWKLAAVIEGWGGPELLASYDAERRPVGLRNVGMTTGFYLAHDRFADGIGAIEDDSNDGRHLRAQIGEHIVRDVGAMFRTMGLQLGYRYEDSPICIPDHTAAPPDKPDAMLPSARPGSRAPHAWLRDGRSILDLFGRGFTLLQFSGEASDGSALAETAKARGVPLAIVAVDEPEAARLYESRLVLVRPDGHVAWRGNAPPGDAGGLIDRMRGA